MDADIKIIDSFMGEYRFLSNFWPVRIEHEGLTYLSSEAAFQAAKTLDMEKRNEFTVMSAGQSKKAGQFVELRKDWDYIKRKVMYDIVKYKFSNHEDLRHKLLITHNAELEEGNTWNDRFWGVCDGQGSNVLGLILMLVRAELRIEEIRDFRFAKK